MSTMSSWSKVVMATFIISPLTAQAGNFSVSPSSGIAYKSPERDFKLKIGGRLHLDYARAYEDKSTLDDGWLVRRARLSLRMDLFKDWRVSAQYDLADEEERFRTLWLRYAGIDNTRITLGQFQKPFGMEESSSSNNILFMERSLADALAPGTNVGLGVQHWGKRWGVKGGAFWETDIEDAKPFPSSESYGFSGRITFAPLKQKTSVLHLGVSASYRLPPDDDRIRIRAQPESDVVEEHLVSSGRMRNVDHVLTTGVEAATTWESWLLKGEYLQSKVNRYGDREDESFDGGYLAASWLINGKQRKYSTRSGVFGRVNTKAGSVWEVAVRYSYLNLNSGTGTITGGKQANTTLGLNWYLNRNARVMFNYIQVDTDAEAGNDDPSILQMRLQLVI